TSPTRRLRAVSLLVVGWRRFEVGQLCHEGVVDTVVFGMLAARYAVGRKGMLRGGTEHDDVVAASRFHDISNDHRDVVDPTLMKRFDNEALSSIVQVRQLQGGLDHVVADQPQ